MKKFIGILGGMGPLATADLFRKITALTKAGCDNDHIRVFIDSNPAIADRTAAILSGGKDPLPEMRAALAKEPAFGMTEDEIKSHMDPARYIGRCPEQVRVFTEKCRAMCLDAASCGEEITL